ncbi:hypothetical protein [Pseudoclavibacter soli]|uniref:hypothetical protein n=1 Tax=Pseudoclavibacter soli TaxID=452623 RepID=UPI00041649DD|nr:hypothetical protein [Pseudoclavibacter soli]
MKALTVISRAQPFLVALLPVLLFFGGGFFVESGWQVLVLGVGAPLLFAGLIVLAVLIWLRPDRRARGGLDWADAVSWLAVTAVTLLAAFAGPFAWWRISLLALVVIVAIWAAGWRLFRESHRLVEQTKASFRGANTAGRPVDIGELTVIEIDPTDQDRPGR